MTTKENRIARTNIASQGLVVYYNKKALNSVSLDFAPKEITYGGPSGSESTL